jgi:hypothetical protein
MGDICRNSPKKEIALFKKEKKPQILSPLPKAPFITYSLIFLDYFYYSPSISI